MEFFEALYRGFYAWPTILKAENALGTSLMTIDPSTLKMYLYFHAAGVYNLNFIAVATPHFIMNYSHTTDGVVWPAQIQQMIVVEVPLTI